MVESTPPRHLFAAAGSERARSADVTSDTHCEPLPTKLRTGRIGIDYRIRLSSIDVVISGEVLTEYLERLSDAGHQDIAATLRTRGTIEGDQKSAALAVIEDWLAHDGRPKLGHQMMGLRTELIRDTSLPPFDGD